MAALDLICCLPVYGRAPLAAVLDALARAAPARIALVKDVNKRNRRRRRLASPGLVRWS
jgi:hypothetical protein